MILSNVKGNTITFKINGNGFEIYSMNNEYRGKANIFVDDKWVGTMDQYSKSPVFKSNSFSKTGLTDGVHTVKIEVLNEKRNEALGTYIAIDYIKVL